MSTPKKKTAKAARPTETATVKAKPVILTASTAIAFKSPRPEGTSPTAPKSKVLAIVKKAGTITLKALTTKAEAEGISADKAAQFIGAMAKAGRVTLT